MGFARLHIVRFVLFVLIAAILPFSVSAQKVTTCFVENENVSFHHADISKDGLIAFSGYDGAEKGIWVLDPTENSCNQIQIGASNPAWSHNGEKIFAELDGDIVVMKPDGTDLNVLIENASLPTVDDSTQFLEGKGNITYLQGGEIKRGYYVDPLFADPKFQEISTITIQGLPGNITDFEWSPDGNLLAIVSEEHIIVRNADGTGAQPSFPGIDPTWSPEAIAFSYVQFSADPCDWETIVEFKDGDPFSVGKYHSLAWFDDDQRFIAKDCTGDYFLFDPRGQEMDISQLTQREVAEQPDVGNIIFGGDE